MVAVRGRGGRHAGDADSGAFAARRAVDAGPAPRRRRSRPGWTLGATSTTNWWAHTTRTTRAEAHRTARLAVSLAHHEMVRAALAAGDLRTDQAGVIVAAVDALPADVEVSVPGAATRFLLDQAAESRREGLAHPGAAVVGGHRPRRSGCRGGPEAGQGGRARTGGGVVHHVRRRVRDVSRPVHPAVAARADAPQGPPRPRRDRPPTLRRQRRRAGRSGARGPVLPAPAGCGVHGPHRVPARRVDTVRGWCGCDGGGDDGAADPPRWSQGGLPRHRWSDQCGAGPQVGVPGRDHPGRPRRRLGGPRRRPQTPVPLRDPTDRDGCARPGVHRVRV